MSHQSIAAHPDLSKPGYIAPSSLHLSKAVEAWPSKFIIHFMSKPMRAKVVCQEVHNHGGSETVIFRPVCKQDGPYPADGSDENNTFAKFSPSGEFKLLICNPALLGVYKPGQAFYVDFTPTEL